jgi:hypothetical protein
MNELGFIKLSRKFLTSEFWTHKRVFSEQEAWIDLIGLAYYGTEPREVTIIDGRMKQQTLLQRGDVKQSFSELSKRWSWSKPCTKRYTKTLLKAGRITLRKVTCNRYIITLAKYGEYNPISKEEKTPKRSPNRTPKRSPKRSPKRYGIEEEDINLRKKKKGKKLQYSYWKGELPSYTLRAPSCQEEAAELRQLEKLYKVAVAMPNTVENSSFFMETVYPLRDKLAEKGLCRP